MMSHRLSRRSTWSLVSLALGAAAFLVWSVPAKADPANPDSQSIEVESGLGAAAGLCSLVYAPAKLAYATGGAVVGGLAWLFSGGDSAVAGPVLNASLRGDYVVTPQNLRGERPLEFVGRSPRDRELQQAVGAQF